MLLALPRILEDNQRLTVIVIGLTIVVILSLILFANIANAKDKHKEKKSARLDAERQGERIADGVDRRSRVFTKEKKIRICGVYEGPDAEDADSRKYRLL